MKIFFGGIIQGSNKGSDVHGQDYRHEIKLLIRQYYSDIRIFDPVEGHESSIDYDDDMAKQTFYKNLSELHSSDLVIAYLPQASMGTAIEMWEAYNRRIPIISISPMTTNWIIRFVSDKNFETVADFESFMRSNDIRKFARKVEEEV
jgi:nucleoside 2-deoxyribosyltransferase